MKKSKKKWLWLLLIPVLLIGAAAGFSWYARQNREPVCVYGFAEGIPGMTDYYDYNNESSGMVTTDRVQNVYISSTQTVLELLVTEGQQVKKGDVLFTYDTTLSDIALMQKDLQVQQAKLDLETAQKELRVINSYVPIRYHDPEPTEPDPDEEPKAELKDFDLTGKSFLAYSGSGATSLTPKYCWIRSGLMLDEVIMEALFSGVSEDVLFLRLQQTEGDKADGAIVKEYGVKLSRVKTTDPNGTVNLYHRFWFFDLVDPDSGPAEPGVDWNSGFTSAEIAAMREEKKAQIKDLEFRIKMEEAEYEIMKKEADSGQVLAEFDGTVVGLLDAQSAEMMGEPMMKITGGGGFYVEGMVSELQLGNIAVGQKVDIMSWDTGMSYEGTITEISQFPVENGYYYYGGSQNVSYYPYTVFIDESAQLRDGFYVSMTLRGNQGAGSLYVQNPFLRSEGAANYVYIRGEDGLLEKRYVQVGGSLWGSYTEIRSGITGEDFLAFPYGKDVVEGAPTREGTWEDLYNY